MCEEKQSAEMFRLGGGFWEGGLEAVEKGTSKGNVDVLEDEDEEVEEEEWEKEAVGALESLASVNVLDGWVLSCTMDTKR